jgi:hypothetical protein
MVVHNIPPGLLKYGFPFAHEEVHRLFNETIQYMLMVSPWDNIFHQLHLTLNQSQKDRGGYHERRTTFEVVIKQT